MKGIQRMRNNNEPNNYQECNNNRSRQTSAKNNTELSEENMRQSSDKSTFENNQSDTSERLIAKNVNASSQSKRIRMIRFMWLP